MFPPIFQIIRKSSQDYQIPETKLVIPSGSMVVIPTYCFHNDPKYYPEPEKFDPERFNDENKAERHSMAFLPFG